MFTLDTFYKSQEWKKLLNVLKMERVDADGNLICQHCGKPIVKAYDAIGHHTVFLTEENVNDSNVGLNPELIQFVHHRCHNFIHNKFGYKQREVFLVYGAPLSGKRTWVQSVMSAGDLIVNLDDIWQCISGCERYVKPNRLKSIAFNVRNVLLDAVKFRAGKWMNAYIIGGYALSSERERVFKELGARSVFIDSSFDDCISRLDGLKIENKDEFKGFIADWFTRFVPDTIPP